MTERVEPERVDEWLDGHAPCEWCGRAIQPLDGMWHATKGAERGYDPAVCDASDDSRHHPPRPVDGGSYGLFDPSNYVTFEEDT